MAYDHPSVPARIATGVAVGLVAGLVASFAMNRFQALAQPASDREGEPATQQAADRIAEDVAGQPPPEEAKPAGGQAVHYGLGAVLGAAYAVAAELAPAVTVGGGVAFAGTTWALLDEAAVPAIGLGNPPWKASAKTQAYGLASHLVFGVTTEFIRRLARAAIDRFGAREPTTKPTRRRRAARPRPRSLRKERT